MLRLATLLLLIVTHLAAQRPPWYNRWRVGAPDGDQKREPMAQNSGLWSYKGLDNIRDDQLAALVRQYRDKAVFMWVFTQCFGAGMFDDLLSTGGAHVGMSASGYKQTARYPRPGGNGYDFAVAFIRSLLQPSTAAQRLALFAAANDPFAGNPQPFPPRRGETPGLEQPWYFNSSDIIVASTADTSQYARAFEDARVAATALQGLDAVPVAPQAKKAAILWSGQPRMTDGRQIAALITILRLLGYRPSDMFVLYGRGRLRAVAKPATPTTPAIPVHPIIQAMLNAGYTRPMINDYLRVASKRQYEMIVTSRFQNMPADPNYMFFFANDHGFNTAINNGGAAPREGGDPGEGDDDEDPAGQENDFAGGGDNPSTPPFPMP
jgi:hypothetical protein